MQVRVFEWVDLLERDPNVDPAQVGRIVASIHRLEFQGRLPTDPWYTDAIGSERWDALLDALHANGAPFAERLSEMRDELVALEGLMEEPRELQTCHRDLWADNVLRTTAGGLCVIDWENCGLADPSQELALVLFEFALGNPQRARALYRAYLEAGGPGRIDRRGNFSMLIAQLGHIGEDACARWLDPGESETERGQHEARAEQFIRWLHPGGRGRTRTPGGPGGGVRRPASHQGRDRRVAHRYNLLMNFSTESTESRFCPMQLTVMMDRSGRFGQTGRLVGVLVVPDPQLRLVTTAC